MSILNFANIRYAGGGVPQGSSTFYSAITLYNARPMITNANIADTGGTGGTEGAIGADFDSFREDDTARGPLIRNDVGQRQQPERPLPDGRDQRVHRADQRDALPDQSRARWADRSTTRSPSRSPYHRLAQLVIGQELHGEHRRRDDLGHQPAVHPARRR